MSAVLSRSMPGSTPPKRTSWNETADRVRCAAALLALSCLVLEFVAASQVAAQEQAAAHEQAAAQEQTVAPGQTAAPGQAAATAQEPTGAVLKLQEVDFYYRSSLAPLSCSALQSRVASILRALGARQDVNVSVTRCEAVIDPLEESMDDPWRVPSDEGWQNPSERWQSRSDRWRGPSSRLRNRDPRREQSTHVTVSLMMPVEVTPEVLDELEKDKSRRALISRVTGNPAASFNDPIVFPARRQLVTLSHDTLELQPEDCELLEEMSRSVFPKLGIGVVRRGPSCGRDEVSRLPPRITVEALMPVMPGSPRLAPAGESEPDPGAPAVPGTKPSDPAVVTPPE